MALFTDGPISTLEQLAAQDSSILDVASTEAIDLTAKLSAAQDEIGIELTAAVARSRTFGSDPIFAWTGGVGSAGGAIKLDNIVVTPALRLWHTFATLGAVYRDAFNNQLNDRYRGKWKEYADLAVWASGVLFQTGLGTVAAPVPMAEAPLLNAASGNSPAAIFYVQVSWLNAQREEGLVSKVASLAAPDQTTLQVTPVRPPANAAAWNVYAGSTVDAITLQNSSPLGLQETWTAPAGGLVLGRAPGNGQEPNGYRSLPRILQRG